MAGIFPRAGVPAADAFNTLTTLPDMPAGCGDAWYSTGRCKPAFDPAAENAMMSELLNAILDGGGDYDCNRLDNLMLVLRRPVINGNIDPVVANLPAGVTLTPSQESTSNAFLTTTTITNPSPIRRMRVKFWGSANASGNVDTGGITIAGRIRALAHHVGFVNLGLGGTITSGNTVSSGGTWGNPFITLDPSESVVVSHAVYYVGGSAGGHTTGGGGGIDAISYAFYEGIAIDG